MMKYLTVFLLILASLSFAAQCVENTFNEVVMSDVGTIVGAAFMLTVILIALAYAGGSILNNQHWTLFAKEEIPHLVFSVILIVSISGIFLVSCMFFTGFLDLAFGPSALNLAATSTCYTGLERPQTIAACQVSRLKGIAERTITASMKKSIAAEMDSYELWSGSLPTSGSASIPTTAYKKAESMQFDLMATSFAMPAYVSLSIQDLFLRMNLDLVKYLLGGALILRILPGTRHFGNVLIAVALVLYIVVPTLYALNGAMDSVVFEQVRTSTTLRPLFSDPVLGNAIDPTSYLQFARIMPQAFFLPNLVIALAVTFIAGISKALKEVG